MINAKDQAKIFSNFMTDGEFSLEDISEMTHIPLGIVKNLASGKSIITNRYAHILEVELGISEDVWK